MIFSVLHCFFLCCVNKFNIQKERIRKKLPFGNLYQIMHNIGMLFIDTVPINCEILFAFIQKLQLSCWCGVNFNNFD